MPIVAEEYQFVIGVDTHAASHSFAVAAPATTAVGAESGNPHASQSPTDSSPTPFRRCLA
jgi:hypothetical protein